MQADTNDIRLMTDIRDIRQPIEEDFRRFEQAFSEALRTENPLLKKVTDYIQLRRGKQLRPILVLLSAQLCRHITDKTLETAVALELMHTASLIHDDVVDSSPIRRGAPTIHEKWSNKVAVLSGDYLLAKVIEIVSQIRVLQILNIVSDLGKQLSSGEILQLHSGQSMWISEEQYFHMIEQKTARLFAACSEAGAVSTGATQRQITAMREYGLCLGMCFQIKDDIFDFSDSEQLGKPTMNDIRDGKATLPLLISLQRAGKQEAADIRQLCEDLARQAEHIDIAEAEQTIKSFVIRYDGIRYSHQVMQEYKRKAEETISIFRDSSTKQALIDLLDYAIHRVK